MSLLSDDIHPLTTATLAELTYMEAFLKECHRLYPVAPYIARESTESIELDGVCFPKRSVFIFNFFALHRSSAVWGIDSEQFNPERFLNKQNGEHHAFGYLPFSGGQRNCIGKSSFNKKAFRHTSKLNIKYFRSAVRNDESESDAHLLDKILQNGNAFTPRRFTI